MTGTTTGAMQVFSEPSFWISVVALGVAGLTYFSNHQKPFDLTAHCAGRTVVFHNFHALIRGEAGEAISVDLIFTNHGAKRGVVYDVAVVLDDKHLFRSYTLDRERRINLGTGALPPPNYETFTGFPIDKYSAEVRRIVFLPFAYPSDFKYQVGVHRAGVYVRGTGKEEWAIGDEFSFTITKDDLEMMDKSIATPQEGGGYFVALAMQDKVTAELDDRVAELQNRLT